MPDHMVKAYHMPNKYIRKNLKFQVSLQKLLITNSTTIIK